MAPDCSSRSGLRPHPDMDTQNACPNLNADTMGLSPAESLASYDNIQHETIASKDRGKVDLAVSDPVLDCDCHVSVRRDCHLLISLTHVYRRRTNPCCAKVDARGGITFGM